MRPGKTKKGVGFGCPRRVNEIWLVRRVSKHCRLRYPLTAVAAYSADPQYFQASPVISHSRATSEGTTSHGAEIERAGRGSTRPPSPVLRG